MKTLQQKNDEHLRLVAKERHSVFLVALSLIPIFVIFSYDLYQWFIGGDSLGHHAASITLGTLIFALPIMIMGQMLIAPNWLKLLLYVALQLLFTSLWFIEGLLWVAVIPVVITFGILQYQLPEIRKRVEQNKNAT
ncbi:MULTISPECIES: hypothetical protein [Shewanella]|uniref:DUF2069 domain-containing protein n=1 Tax=Shewanella marisflavi TaxID=260364 RepID=A0ABX5WLE9_9GAMM|nr:MULTISPECIES: hypothetical protein [Shewanella]MCL1041048.1 hypothetical protein [Shewanella marisflavi]QDF75408.1 hypothetical protein FGA12_09720 [Shewanella marisflavi]